MNYYLKFVIGTVWFAVPIEEVKEIARPKTVLKQENVTKSLFGFFKLRKRRLPLYDLPKFFKIEADAKFEVIISEVNRKQIGFKVNKVLGIIAIKELVSFPQLVKPKDYFRGVIKEGDSIIQVLSFIKLISGVRLRTIKKYL